MINEIITKGTRCVFVSPHFDDAIFSAGGLMARLSEKVPLSVINVFTSPGDGRNTLSAKTFLRQCSYKSAHKLFVDRESEDRKTLKQLGAKVVNLGEVDALWRGRKRLRWPWDGIAKKLPEIDRVYPTYRLHISRGNINRSDRDLSFRLAGQLAKLVPDRSTRVFCPMGIGLHVDHVLVRDACTHLFLPEQLIYWSDFPYCLSSKSPKNFIKIRSLEPITIRHNGKTKVQLCRQYKTQFKQVITDVKSVDLPETYFVYKKDSPPHLPIREKMQSHLFSLIHSPKDYLYNMIFPTRGLLKVLAYSKKQKTNANKIIGEIKQMIPTARPRLIGSTGLEIAGQGDVDILVPCQPEQLESYTIAISKRYGAAQKKNAYIVQWKLKINGHQLDLDLISSASSRYREQIRLFEILKNNPGSRLSYEALKYRYQERSVLDFIVARMGFFYRVIRYFEKQ